MLQPQDSKTKVDLTKCLPKQKCGITDKCTLKKHGEITSNKIGGYMHTASPIYGIAADIPTTYAYISNIYFSTHVEIQRADHSQWLPQAGV